MKQNINNGELAFAYECKFTELQELLKHTEYSIEHKVPPTNKVYVTGISEDDTVLFTDRLFLSDTKFDQIAYAKLEIAVQDSLELESMAKRVSRNLILQNQRIATPIYRFIKHRRNRKYDIDESYNENIGYAQELGIQQWHHLLFIGDKIYVYVWDTRVVEKVLTIEQTKDLSKRMLRQPLDNNAPLVFTPETEQYRKEFELMTPTVHPVFHPMSIDQELSQAILDE
jgi:hypothetical protein